jgi:hypothetical protein
VSILSSRAAGPLLGQHGRFAAAHDVLGPMRPMRRVDREHLADDQLVEQHVDHGEMQFDGRLGAVICSTSI